MNVIIYIERNYVNKTALRLRKNKANQSQFPTQRRWLHRTLSYKWVFSRWKRCILLTFLKNVFFLWTPADIQCILCNSCSKYQDGVCVVYARQGRCLLRLFVRMFLAIRTSSMTWKSSIPMHAKSSPDSKVNRKETPSTTVGKEFQSRKQTQINALLKNNTPK